MFVRLVADGWCRLFREKSTAVWLMMADLFSEKCLYARVLYIGFVVLSACLTSPKKQNHVLSNPN
jgi:hypothetical protein